MKNMLHTLLWIGVLLVAPLMSYGSNSEGRKRVAVVLSGGGAKGVAHIGALRAIEEAGIPVDFVVGTSMGAIVGGLYSIGYSTDQLDSMVLSQDWGLLLSDRTPRRNRPYSEKESEAKYLVSYPFSFSRSSSSLRGLIEGTNLEMLFNDMMVGYHDSLDFRQFPIPFACVAADIVDGSEIVFDRGVLPMAMRASMAIPGVFAPVYDGERVLVDGGLVNNYPSDVARAMGADIVIGVDVQSTLRPREDLEMASNVVRQIIEMSMQNSDYRAKVKDTDLHIKVDVSGYSSASFNTPAIDTLIRRGYRSASAHRDNLMALRRSIGLPEDWRPAPRKEFVPLSKRGRFLVYNINFEELSPRQRRWVMRNCRIRENSFTSVSRLRHCVSMLSAATSHTGAYFALRDTLDGYNIDFHMDAVKGNSVSAGVNFDSEEIASVVVNGTFRLSRKHVPMEASVTARFGERLAIDADYALLFSPMSGFRFNYVFNYDNVDINYTGRRLYNLVYNRHKASLSLVNMNFLRQNLRLELGAAFRKYYYMNMLADYRQWGANAITGQFDQEVAMHKDLDARLWSYYMGMNYETLDNLHFAMRGTAISSNFEVFTDNFYGWRGGSPFSQLSLSFTTAIPFTRKFSLIPSLYGRALWGDAPFQLGNMVGGKFFGRYFPQQMPFDGIAHVEMAPNLFLAAKIQARRRFWRRHYVSASFNYAVAANDAFTPEAERKHYYGASLDYGFDLRGFPLQASVGWSNATKSVGFYLLAGYMF